MIFHHNYAINQMLNCDAIACFQRKIKALSEPHETRKQDHQQEEKQKTNPVIKNSLYKLSIILCLIMGLTSSSYAQDKPFSLPPLKGEKIDFHSSVPALKKAPEFPFEDIHQAVIACYPEKSTFEDLDITLRAGSSLFETESQFSRDDKFGIGGKFYAGIFAELPLYSDKEISRKREREYKRRVDTAKLVSDLSKYIHERNLALRLRDISLLNESRSRARLKKGLAPVDENIKYMKDVAKYENDLNTAKTNIEAVMLALVGQCSDHKRDKMISYLKEALKP